MRAYVQFVCMFAYTIYGCIVVILSLFSFLFVLCECLQGGALGRYVQRKLSGLKIFEESFALVRENLRMGVTICEQWVAACDHLTGQVWSRSKWRKHHGQSCLKKKVDHHIDFDTFAQVWKRYAPHAWKGNKHCPQTLHCLAKRLDEVKYASIQEQSTRRHCFN